MKLLGVAAVSLFAWVLGAATIARADVPPVYAVIFTHVEDNTPGGMLGSAQSRQSYNTTRANLIAMAHMADSAGIQWTLQPDWKILEAALLYEDSTLKATTGGKNFLRYLKEDIGAVIDPHSHESGGYNYTDVAHLLDSLGVGGTTVIGGHVWDPSLPQFQEWDRYRVPVAGQHYPGALWRGDILIGSGTPNHVNDPIVSGVWRPRDRDHYFDHDPAANITAIGNYKRSVSTIQELINAYRSGSVPPTAMLTYSGNVPPSTLSAPGGLQSVRDTVISPLVAWRDSGLVIATDFTSLIHAWETTYGAQSYMYWGPGVLAVPDARSSLSILALAPCRPNPVSSRAELRYSLGRDAHVRLAIYDLTGRRVATLADGPETAGEHTVRWDASRAAPGAYLCRLEEVRPGAATGSAETRKILVLN